MSIALESSSNRRIEGSGFVHGLSCISVYESTEPRRSFAGEGRFPAGNMARMAATKVEERGEEDQESCSSSIGRNSDLSGKSTDEESPSDETEVQSSYKGPMDRMDALEEVLPIRRGISKFYNGKSKSFTSLGDAAFSSSAKDFAKPENAYTRKRKNLLAWSIISNKNRSNYPWRSNDAGISKRPANSSRSSLALAVNTESTGARKNSNSPPQHRPPLHPQAKSLINQTPSSSPPSRNFSPWRSFSLTDLQCAAATSNLTSSSVTNIDRDNHKAN